MDGELLLVIISLAISVLNSLIMLFKRIKKSECECGQLRIRTESMDDSNKV
jgi:hypothetical protein